MSEKINIKQLVKEELENIMSEESDFAKNYIPMQVKDFIAKSDAKSPYKPQIKLHWGGDNGEANTNWIGVPWEFISSIVDYFQKNPPVEESATQHDKILENMNLTDAEIGVLAAAYNKYSGGGPVADKKNYQYIQPEFAKEALQKYIADKNATDNGKLLASAILKKLSGK